MMSIPSSSSAVFLRPWVSTTAATRSVPRSRRRCACRALRRSCRHQAPHRGRCATRPASAWSRARRAAHRSPTTCPAAVRRRKSRVGAGRCPRFYYSQIDPPLHQLFIGYFWSKAMLSSTTLTPARRGSPACGLRCGTRRVGELRLDSLRGSSRRARSEVRRRRGDVRVQAAAAGGHRVGRHRGVDRGPSTGTIWSCRVVRTGRCAHSPGCPRRCR